MAAAAVGNNIASGEGPAYVVCALPYRADADREAEWGLDTALAIVEEAVDAFDPPRIEARPVRVRWPEALRESARGMDTFEVMRSAYFARGSPSLPELSQAVPRLEANFHLWLSCRKQQWRKHRADKRARHGFALDDDFSRHDNVCYADRSFGGHQSRPASEYAVSTLPRLTPEEDFPRWLKQRKWHWKASKMERESRNTPPLEEDFYRWLAERKKVWRLQRLAKRHSGGRGLLLGRNDEQHHGDADGAFVRD